MNEKVNKCSLRSFCLLKTILSYTYYRFRCHYPLITYLSEKNTKFENKSGRFFQIFVAFSEDLNFNGNCHFLLGLNSMKVLKSTNEHFGIRVHRCHLSFFELKNKLTHLLIRRDHRVNGNCLCLIDHYPTAYTAQCSNPQLPGIKTEEQIIDIESFITL